MNASELNRQLLFYGYSEATDFLNNSPLNRYLYKQFLYILPKYGIDIPMVKLFNEIYYQCVRVNYDGTPGLDIKQRYIEEESEWLKSENAANLVFVVVWAILKKKTNLTFHEDCFLSQIKQYMEGCELFEIGRYIYRELWALKIVIPNSFPLSIIEKYVRLYSNPDDQLELIDRILRTIPLKKNTSVEEFLMNLVDRIKAGNFDTDESSAGRGAGDCRVSHKTTSAENIKVVGDLKLERDELKRYIDELKKSHQMELARMEAQYKAEIDKTKKERNILAHEPVARENQGTAPKPKELTLTLTEIVAFVKERFSKSGADEICTMLYRKAVEHGYLGEDTFKLLDGIVPAIIKRDKPQTNVDIKETGQVNINPQEINNRYTKG